MTVSEINKKIIKKLNVERQVCDDYRQYLHGLLTEYVKDIEGLSLESIIVDLPIKLIHDQLVAEIKKSVSALIRAYGYYSKGQLSTAIEIMRNRFIKGKNVVKFSTLSSSQDWFRARKLTSIQSYEPKDMFHIPFEKRSEVVNYRFSITGYPCLYLGSSILSCWEEMHCPSLDDFAVSRVNLTKGCEIQTLDIRLPDESADNSALTDSDKREENLMRLKTWPLIIACAIKTINPDSCFKYEYIHPQLLMLAMKETYKDLFGIMYTSTHFDNAWSVSMDKYTNVAIPVKKIQTKGYCDALKRYFRLSRGIPFIEAEVKNVFGLVSNISLNEKTGLIGYYSYDDGSAPYEKTKFGQMEAFLKSSGVTLEQVK